MNGTIKETADKGYLDLVMQPERRNTIKVLLFFDIGGSMDSHIKVCEELFSAARPSSRPWSSSTSTTASTRASGRTQCRKATWRRPAPFSPGGIMPDV